jgi:fibrillarin-like pre-rRNA processing protein
MTRRGTPFAADRRTERLRWRRFPDRAEVWTVALGEPPEVYGESISTDGTATLRRWDPTRSKLAAALLREWDGEIPRERTRWLYLGAATGTTASHVADLVGPAGVVYAVERSPRPFVKLLRLAERYPNLYPVLADARDPSSYLEWVGPVDGLYADIAQPDQVEIAIANADRFLRENGQILLALKTASMGRERSPRAHLAAAEAVLASRLPISDTVGLEPFHRQHFLIGGRFRPQRGTAEAEPSSRARSTGGTVPGSSSAPSTRIPQRRNRRRGDASSAWATPEGSSPAPSAMTRARSRPSSWAIRWASESTTRSAP